jgi:hypothetical protein
VLSDDTLSVLVPILEEVGHLDSDQIRELFRQRGLLIQEWDRGRTDWLTIRAGEPDWGDDDGRAERDRLGSPGGEAGSATDREGATPTAGVRPSGIPPAALGAAPDDEVAA